MIRLLNWLSDKDWGWFPFLFLRPPKSERITVELLVKMSLYYGIAYGLLLGVVIATIAARRGEAGNGLAGIVVVTLEFVPAFFVAWGVFFALPWNARARQLAHSPSPATEAAPSAEMASKRQSGVSRGIKIALLLLFAWTAVRTVWIDWRRPDVACGTAFNSFVLRILLPLAVLVLTVAIADARRIAKGQSRDRVDLLIVAIEAVGLLAVGVEAVRMFSG